MCGIFGYIGKRKEAARIVLEGLKTLEYRGYDSWGIGALDCLSGKIILAKKTGKIGNANINNLPKTGFAIGHTRWATHGGVTKENAHPHLDCNAKLALIHNGIIENYDSIKKDLLKTGHRFVSQTDSEVAVHLIEENYKQLLKSCKDIDRQELFVESVRQSFNQFTGLNAIIVMNAQTQTFIAAKNGSPLIVGLGEDENFLASDAHALLPYTHKVYFMEDGEIVRVTGSEFEVFESKTGKNKKVSFTNIDWKTSVTKKGDYPYFMLKEIMDQPKVIADILANNKEQISQFSKLIHSSYGTYLVGCGTAAYACLAGTYIFSKITKRHVNFSVGSEFGYLVDFLTEKSLVIALSQSGETIDVIEAVKKAKEKGAKIGTLVNVLGSTLYRVSDYKLLLNAGVEKAVVSTKAFTAKLAYLTLLAYYFAHQENEGKKVTSEGVQVLKEILAQESLKKIQKLVKFLLKKEHIYIIGRGISYPIALEAALKIKEASYIHAEGFAAGELKHGAIALVEKGTPCIVFLPNDETYAASLAGAMEMKARGGVIIGISYKNNDIFDYYIPVKDCGIAWIIPAIAVCQLLGYYLAVGRGYDPDKPRNLAKSVTVK